MKIIVTGATGSLGAFLTRWFSAKGHEVIALGRVKNPPPRLLEYANYIRADIVDLFELPPADVCIHTAAIADDKTAYPELFRTNVQGTENVARAARNCSIFIHVSSSSVYASSDNLLTEEMAGERSGEKLSAYGKSKLLAERRLMEVAENTACFILRPRGIYGPGDKVLLPRLLELVRKGKMLRTGSMQVRLSMTHFDNFAIAVENCMNAGLEGFHIYNVADDDTYILYGVVRKFLAELYSRDLPEKALPVWMLRLLATLRIGGITPLFINTVTKNHVLDTSKIKSELNYLPLMNVDAALPELGVWVKNIGGIKVLKSADPRLAWEV